MPELSNKTRDDLLVAIACGVSVLLKAAAADPDFSESERDSLKQMVKHTETVIEAALQEKGL